MRRAALIQSCLNSHTCLPLKALVPGAAFCASLTFHFPLFFKPGFLLFLATDTALQGLEVLTVCLLSLSQTAPKDPAASTVGNNVSFRSK